MADIKDVINGLECCTHLGCHHGCAYRNNERCRTLLEKDVLELLKELPKWIPINERKPNSCGTYIVARWFIDGCRRKILTDACYFDGSNTWHDDTRVNHSRPYLTDKIVAWMPLPNPPEDGEQE